MKYLFFISFLFLTACSSEKLIGFALVEDMNNCKIVEVKGGAVRTCSVKVTFKEKEIYQRITVDSKRDIERGSKLDMCQNDEAVVICSAQ